MGADFRITWLDRLLMGMAPDWGLRRVKARAAAMMMARSYEAAGGGRRTAGWHRRATDANAAAAGSLVQLRELGRDLRRNNGWARRGIEAIANNTIGWGIEAKAAGVGDELAARAGALWRAWADSARCDYDGRQPFTGLQNLVMSTIAESGEAIVVREDANTSDGLPLSAPVRIRVLEPDYLDVSRDSQPGVDGGEIVQGVETDGRGRRVAYWLYDHHPGATSLSSMRTLRFVSRRIPADRVIHVYRVERPGQMRGVSWLASAIVRLQDFGDWEDAVLMQQKIAACFGAFVQDLDGAGTPVGEPDATDDHLEKLEPGHIEYLSPGQTVTFATPPTLADHGMFTSTSLRGIAVSLGVTYEDLTGDYSQVNFSSARMARLAHWANVHSWRWHMLIPQLCDGVWRWVMERAAALEGWPEVPRAEWAPPPMPMLEPDKEGLAYQRLIRSGIKTLPEAIRENGGDPKAHLAEIAASNKMLDDLEIWLDSDPRRVSAQGLTQERVGERGSD